MLQSNGGSTSIAWRLRNGRELGNMWNDGGRAVVVLVEP